MESRRDDGYWVSDDKDHLDLDRIHGWLSEESYWAEGRSRDLVRRSIRNSITIGCFAPDGNQVGVCRWVTDTATFAWLCDVFVDAAHRGGGLGVFLVRFAMEHPDVQGIRLLLLGTRDAHDRYRKFGFGTASENLMERRSAGRGSMREDSPEP
jgi:GNAT superfamily N-acetyltransferase